MPFEWLPDGMTQAHSESHLGEFRQFEAWAQRAARRLAGRIICFVSWEESRDDWCFDSSCWLISSHQFFLTSYEREDQKGRVCVGGGDKNNIKSKKRACHYKHTLVRHRSLKWLGCWGSFTWPPFPSSTCANKRHYVSIDRKMLRFFDKNLWLQLPSFTKGKKKKERERDLTLGR